MRFGDVVGLDYEPDLRAMLVALNRKATAEHTSGRPVWNAIVLSDVPAHPEAWETGKVVTVLIGVAGLVFIEEAESLA